MIPSAWLDLAARRLSGQVERTPLTYDPELDLSINGRTGKRPVLLKSAER